MENVKGTEISFCFVLINVEINDKERPFFWLCEKERLWNYWKPFWDWFAQTSYNVGWPGPFVECLPISNIHEVYTEIVW